jgi:hypothetical protein
VIGRQDLYGVSRRGFLASEWYSGRQGRDHAHEHDPSMQRPSVVGDKVEAAPM